MDSDAAAVDKVPKSPCAPKVHDALCCELMKVSDKIIKILPAIESAQPGSSSGIQVLCSLNNTIEKIKLLVCYCAESSKLYLAITAEPIKLRCQRILTYFSQSLHQINSMVPLLLASKISVILDHLRDVKFIIDPGEDEAGKALLNLLEQTVSSEDQEFQIFQFVTSRLNITSAIAVLDEKRSIKKLLNKFQGVDDKKERILKYFLYLLTKYGILKELKPGSTAYKESTSTQDSCLSVINSESDACKISVTDLPCPNHVDALIDLPNNEMPPAEFCYPISSRLMYDPVIIASGQTFERVWIHKSFSEGQDTCPKSQKKLENLSVLPNSDMKGLLSNWSKKHVVTKEASLDLWQSSPCNSILSLKNVSTALLDGTNGVCLHESELMKQSAMSFGANCPPDSSPINDDKFFSWSDDYRRYGSFSNFTEEMYLRFLFELSGLPTLLQEQVVEHLQNTLEGDEVAFCGMLSNGFAEALMLFLKKSHILFDTPAQRCGARIFHAFMNNKRWELNSFCEHSFQLMSSFLNFGLNTEALMILQKLAHRPHCISHIAASSIPLDLIHYLYSGENKYVEIVLKIISELSFHGEVRFLFLFSKFIEKLGELLSDRKLVKLCLNILHNLFDDEEASMVISDANGCITSIAAILESGDHEEQEQAATILLVLCSRSSRNCLLVLKEGVIPSLVYISVNGEAKGKESSVKLLHVLSDNRHSDCLDDPPLFVEPESDLESVWRSCSFAMQPETEGKILLRDIDASRRHPKIKKFSFCRTRFHSCIPALQQCTKIVLSGQATPNGSLVEHPMENSQKLQPKHKCFGFFNRKLRSR